MKVVKAMAPEKCDICARPLRKYSSYIDGRTSRGPWAWMCAECFQYMGTGLGTGRGQEYDSQTNNKLRG